jgi:two-component system, OmpR family, phosphate regulon response regulator PhoB
LIRGLLERALATQGYGVLSAETAEAGLALARERCPNLVVTDLNMPGMGGLELILQIRSDPGLGGTSLLAMTGNITGPLDLAGRLGADTTLLKPFRLEDLLDEVRRLLRGGPQP